MNYGHAYGLQASVRQLAQDLSTKRERWLQSRTDAQLVALIGPLFNLYFDTLDPTTQRAMAYDRSVVATVLEDYRVWYALQEPGV